jgi:hypothetical protein
MSAVLADLRALARGKLMPGALGFGTASVLAGHVADVLLRDRLGAAPDLGIVLPAMCLMLVAYNLASAAYALGRARREAHLPGHPGSALMAATLAAAGILLAMLGTLAAVDGLPSAGLAQVWLLHLAIGFGLALWPLPLLVLGTLAGAWLGFSLLRWGITRDPVLANAAWWGLMAVLGAASALAWRAGMRGRPSTLARASAAHLVLGRLRGDSASSGVLAWRLPILGPLRLAPALPVGTPTPKAAVSLLLGAPFGPSRALGWAVIAAIVLLPVLVLLAILPGSDAAAGRFMLAGMGLLVPVVMPGALLAAGARRVFGGGAHVLHELVLLPGLGDARRREAMLASLLWRAPLRWMGGLGIALALLAIAFDRPASAAWLVLAGGATLVIAGGLHAIGWRRRPGGTHALGTTGLLGAHALVAIAWAALLSGVTTIQGLEALAPWMLGIAALLGIPTQWQAFAAPRRAARPAMG